jgi:hypothetical protein
MDSHLTHACNWYVNNLIPQNAKGFKELLNQNSLNSQEAGWKKIHTSVVLTRVIGVLTIPAALLETGSYAIRGIAKGTVKLLDGKFESAWRAFIKNEVSAFRFIAVAIGQVGYAVLGLLAGASVYSCFNFIQAIPEIKEDINNLLEKTQKQLHDTEEEFNKFKLDTDAKIVECSNQVKTSEENGKSELADYQNKIKALENEINNLKKHEQEIIDLKKQIINYESQIKSVTTFKNLHLGNVNTLKADNNKLTTKNTILANTNKELTTKNKELTTKYNQSTHNNNNLRKLNQNHKEAAQKDEATHHHSVDQYAKLKDAYAQLMANFKALANENEKLKHPNDTQQSDDFSNSFFLMKPSVLNNSDLNASAKEVIPLIGVEKQPAPARTWLQGVFKVVCDTSNTIIMLGNDYLAQPLRKLFIDNQDPYKNNRYMTALAQFQTLVGKDEIDSLLKAKGSADEGSHDLSFLHPLKDALNFLKSPEISRSGHDQRDGFLKNLRNALLFPRKNLDSNISSEYLNRTYEICKKWMTSIEMLPFNYQMCSYVASKGNEEIQKTIETSNSLYEIFHGMLTGIANADPKYKSPVLNLIPAKAKALLNTFDPLLEGTNMPSKIATMTYKDTQGNERKIQEFRTGVPVGPKSPDINSGNKDWEDQGIALVPEYIGFLNALKAANAIKKEGEPKEKLLVVLHLNPKYYNSNTKELRKPTAEEAKTEQPFVLYLLSTTWRAIKNIPDDLDLKQREAVWIKLIQKLANSKEFEDVISLALVPMDGDWLKKDIEECKTGKTLAELKEHLLQVITNEKSPYIIPHMIDNEKNAFVRAILEGTSKQYFTTKFKKEDKLDIDQMLAFVGIFNNHLIEALQIKEKATLVQRNCKDGVDRTMALVGSELLERYLRVGKLYAYETKNLVKNTLKNILGTVCGPALGILKRELLEERQPILLATAKFLDSLLPNEISEAPNYEEFKLTNIEMGEDQNQCLYPTPSTIETDEEYKKLIRFELDHPFAVSHEFKLKSNPTVDNLREPLEILANRYSHVNLNYQIVFDKDNFKEETIDNIRTIKGTCLLSKALNDKREEMARINIEIYTTINEAENTPIFTYALSEFTYALSEFTYALSE